METEAAAASGSDQLDTAVLAVDGMHCSSCVALIEETLVEDLGVNRAEVDLESGRAVVVYDGSRYTPEDLCDAVAAVGYTARIVDAAS